MVNLSYCSVTSIGSCNHHCHVTEDTILTIKSYLGVPPCYAAKQTILIQSLVEGSETMRVRIVGPSRSFDQVEVMKSDIPKLKVTPPIKESGDIRGTPGFRMIGPKGSVTRQRGLVIAEPHLHLAFEESDRLMIYNGDRVDIKTCNGHWLKDINVRVDRFPPARRSANKYINEVHIDKDDAEEMDLPLYSKAFIYMDEMDWLERRML